MSEYYLGRWELERGGQSHSLTLIHHDRGFILNIQTILFFFHYQLEMSPVCAEGGISISRVPFWFAFSFVWLNFFGWRGGRRGLWGQMDGWMDGRPRKSAHSIVALCSLVWIWVVQREICQYITLNRNNGSQKPGFQEQRQCKVRQKGTKKWHRWTDVEQCLCCCGGNGQCWK